MKIITRFLIVSLLAATSAQAQTPLVIIRFNQPNVYYDQQLYMAVSKAVAIKPDLMIDVVSYSPQTGSSSTDEDWQEAASKHTQKVVNTLQQIGVPASRINVSGQRQAGLRYDETHVFVR